MSTIPELITACERVIAFGEETPEANRRAVSEALAPLLNYRTEFPFTRISANQALLSSEGSDRPDGWAIGSHISCELVEIIDVTSAWDQKSELSKEFLTACGSEDITLVSTGGAAIWRLSWSDVPAADLTARGANTFFLHTSIAKAGFTSYTQKAIIKLESGEVENTSFAKGAEVGICKITGWIVSGKSRYTSVAPRISSSAGSALVALPAMVSGVHPDDRWGFFYKYGE